MPEIPERKRKLMPEIPERIRVEVKQHHIEGAEVRGRQTCPIAKALKEQTGFPSVNVDKEHVNLNDGALSWLLGTPTARVGDYDLPPEGRKFVEDFDAGRPIGEITLDLVRIPPAEMEARLKQMQTASGIEVTGMWYGGGPAFR